VLKLWRSDDGRNTGRIEEKDCLFVFQVLFLLFQINQQHHQICPTTASAQFITHHERLFIVRTI
jgi:hypothetical protein